MRPPRFILFVIGWIVLAFADSSSGAHVIPFEYRDGLIWVKVSAGANGARLNFLLDSGAGASVINLGTAKSLGVRLGQRAKVKLVGTGASAWRVRDFQATVAGIPISQTPLALDLSATSVLCSRVIDGLLGEDFFRGRIVEIDFRALCLRLLDRADATSGRLCAVMPLKVVRDAMLVPVSVNGAAHQWTRLDTGCDDGLHWVADGGRGYVQSSVQMGGERLHNVKTALHHAPIFPYEAGLIGNQVLSNYRVTIDRVNSRVLLVRI